MNVSDVDANLRRCPSAGAVFETYDLDVGREYINSAYGTRARIRGSGRNELVRHARHDFGSFSLNDITLGLDTNYEVGPLGSLVVLQPRGGWIDRNWGDSSSASGPVKWLPCRHRTSASASSCTTSNSAPSCWIGPS